MPSAAGRRLVWRSLTALRCRATAAAGSAAYARRSTSARNRRSPHPSVVDRSAIRAASIARRSARLRQAVPCAIWSARHSLHQPACIAASVCGSSRHRTTASPRWMPPRCGDSRRARATSAPMPRSRSAAGRWARSSTRAVFRATASRACAAATVFFSDSSSSIRSTASPERSPGAACSTAVVRASTCCCRSLSVVAEVMTTR